jgi:uncharacterized protein (TIGR01777 family)
MRFVVAGASGFLGTALRDHVARDGHEVVRLVRGEPVSPQESRWDPSLGQVDQEVVERADVVVNLAGAPIAHWPWTESYQRKLLDSRVATTGTLARAVAAAATKPVLLAQNGIAGYGDRGDEVLTEDSSTDAPTALGKITRAWEDATQPARGAGARVCVMRTSVVLDRRGGALKTMLLPFRLGLGGPLGSGEQYFATISLTDWLRAVSHLAGNEGSEGAYNLAGPNTTTNREFTRELGRLLNRPTVLPAPARPIRMVLGELSNELLGSARVEPARLRDEGFAFEHTTVGSRLEAGLNP